MKHLIHTGDRSVIDTGRRKHTGDPNGMDTGRRKQIGSPSMIDTGQQRSVDRQSFAGRRKHAGAASAVRTPMDTAAAGVIPAKRRGLHAALALVAAASLLICGALGAQPVEAKTISSDKAENVFFYVKNVEGKDVLVDIVSLDELKPLAHGIKGSDGTEHNYYASTTDNYPTTQYCESRGFTIMEFVDFIKEHSTVPGASGLRFASGDTMRFMATDSYGSYTRSWTWDELYGVKRYYFEGLYNETSGWNSAWEVGGEDNSKFGLSLEDYESKYRASDAYYENKRAVFDNGEESEVTLATESLSGRTTSESLNASTELGLSGYIQANDGVVAGCLEDELTDDYSLRLCIPMTEADLMSAHRTAYDNFKWVYNVELSMENGTAPASQGTVAAPKVTGSVSGDKKTLTLTMSCDTPGASIYYSFSAAPQTLYTGPVTYDITDRNLDSSPVTIYVTAVKEGYDDAGMQIVKYPSGGVNLKTIYQSMSGQALTLEAAEDVTDEDWNQWAGSLLGISAKIPGGSGYASLDASKYTVNHTNKTITIDQSVFEEPGAYSFLFYARGFSNKTVSLTIKKAAPEIAAPNQAVIGDELAIRFDDDSYQNSAYLYVKAPDSSQTVMIPSSSLDRTQPGTIIIKKEYFTHSSSAIQEPGTYTIQVVNNSYAPSTQEFTVDFTKLSEDDVSLRFEDVSSTVWFHDAVQYVYDNKYFAGTSDTTFSPDDHMTRAMFVTVLGRLAGVDTSEYTRTSFTDVEEDQWYTPYIEWASQNEIVKGVGDGLFNPQGSVTREQMALILYNYEKKTGNPEEPDVTSGDWRAFPDAGAVSDWAQEAMAWAVGNKIINGADGMLMPSGTATRAQVAQIILNWQKGSRE